MRWLFVLLLAVVTSLGLSSCGGDDEPSRGATTGSSANRGGASAPAAEGEKARSGGSQAREQSRPEESRRRSRSVDQRKRALARRPSARRSRYKGRRRLIYIEARSRCLSIPLRSLASLYDASGSEVEDVARAYAGREAPTGSGRAAAIDGCLDGINTRLRMR